jgi:hypothetical protein
MPCGATPASARTTRRSPSPSSRCPSSDDRVNQRLSGARPSWHASSPARPPSCAADGRQASAADASSPSAWSRSESCSTSSGVVADSVSGSSSGSYCCSVSKCTPHVFPWGGPRQTSQCSCEPIAAPAKISRQHWHAVATSRRRAPSPRRDSPRGRPTPQGVLRGELYDTADVAPGAAASRFAAVAATSRCSAIADPSPERMRHRQLGSNPLQPVAVERQITKRG